MKIACTGLKPGRIATALIDRGVRFIEADVTDATAFRKAIKSVDPDVIIHTAAMTDVEECEAYPIQAKRVNVDGVENIVSWWDGKLIYLSTDHVFNGQKWFPGGYSERHKPNPVNIYGLTKLAGEMIAVNGHPKAKIIRTSKVFSYRDLRPMLQVLSGELYVPFAFTGLILRSFLYVDHFVNGLLNAVRMFDQLPPILNISGTSIISHAQFWFLVCNIFGFDEQNVTTRKQKLKDAAPRPFRCGLDVREASNLGIPLYSAADGLKEVKELWKKIG